MELWQREKERLYGRESILSTCPLPRVLDPWREGIKIEFRAMRKTFNIPALALRPTPTLAVLLALASPTRAQAHQRVNSLRAQPALWAACELLTGQVRPCKRRRFVAVSCFFESYS